MSLISIQNLFHEFAKHNEEGEKIGSFNALDGVSMDVEKGDFIAILGRNGSGKSTLAKHINALLYPSAGKVYVADNDTEDDDKLLEIRQTAGMVFQNPDNQIIATVVEEDVAFGPENLGVPGRELRLRVDEALEKVRMTEFAGKDPGKLSGGQKQRVAIAGVLAMKPECIILDEPTAMLDPIGRKEVLEAVHELNRDEKMTVILVTHHMNEVTGADKVFVMDSGKVAAYGTPHEIFSDAAKIKALGLDVPQVTEIADMLRENGVDLGNVIDIPEFVASFREKFDHVKHGRTSINPEIPDFTEKQQKENVTPQLSLKNVSYVYAPGTSFEKTAVNSVSFDIKKGEFVAIIGHTGSGKSTLITMLNALEKPSTGKILYEGSDIQDEDYDRRNLRAKVGLVFQYPDHQLFEETIYKDVAFGPTNLGLTKEEINQRVRKSLTLVGIPEEQYNDSPMELSGGQKKRVTIAGVLAMQPEVLILDEPTAGLDPAGRDDILSKIDEIHESTGCTIVWVSHSMESVAKHADRIIVLNNGHVEYDDMPLKVFAHAEELEKIGLSVPEATKLMYTLKEAGFDVSTDIITSEDSCREILHLL
ncbi:MAG: energy-coupling factor transporter ATPase [Lachnospiraceae bacterium]|nr:energy-coupling factor transporter ATPase [Lachnospiraceae bacterium]